MKVSRIPSRNNTGYVVLDEVNGTEYGLRKETHPHGWPILNLKLVDPDGQEKIITSPVTGFVAFFCGPSDILIPDAEIRDALMKAHLIRETCLRVRVPVDKTIEKQRVVNVLI